MQKSIAALSLFAFAISAQAQQFPSKPIRMIVGFTAGGEVDVIGRMIAHEMSEKWGQRVVIDNRPGAGSTVAGAIVTAANPDGYTLFFNTVSHAAIPALYPNAVYGLLPQSKRNAVGRSTRESVAVVYPAS